MVAAATAPTLQRVVHLQEKGILLQELLSFLLVPCGDPSWWGSLVVVHSDNLGAVAVVNLGYSKVLKDMHSLRRLFFIRAHFNFSVRAVHVSGTQNCWADATSII